MSEDPQPAIELWFFRDLSDEQRYKLGVLCGLPGEAWPVSHTQQRMLLRHIIGRLRAPDPAHPGMVSEARDAATDEAISDVADITARAKAMGLGMVKYFVPDIERLLAALAPTPPVTSEPK